MQASRLETIEARAYRIPTDLPEADGTFDWDSTSIVVVKVCSDGRAGWGYTYSDAAAANLINATLAPAVAGCDLMATTQAWERLVRVVRNLGRPGLASCAISAVDCAFWDLKCRLLDVPLVALLGDARERVATYASGGFTSYSAAVLQERLARWVRDGFTLLKMKIGSRPSEDVQRVQLVREAIGAAPELFVDANGAYSRKQALAIADKLAACGVTWFEEPVSSDDLQGLRLVRDRAPAGMDVAAGEYGYDSVYFRRMLEHGAVDVLQADITRCGGLTGFCRVAALADAHGIPLSAHCAPTLHVHPCCALPGVRHIECFHDHVRIEAMLLEGAPQPEQGTLMPTRSRPGFGFELREQEAARYAVD